MISLLLGGISLINHPTIKEIKVFKVAQSVNLKGHITAITANAYNKQLILNHVCLNKQHLRSKVQVIVDLKQEHAIGDVVEVHGKVEAFPTLINPSDFNYGNYLKSQNIVAVIKAKSLKKIRETWQPFAVLRGYLKECLYAIYKGKDEGIMEAALLGSSEALEAETRALYSAVGIGHVLCVSGFHVGLVVSFFLGVSALIGLSYNKRYMVSILGIWFYCILTGMSASTVRASIMATLVMGARIIWEEEDFLTSIAISGFLNLLWRPYQLFNMGFQLSYAAVLAIGISQLYLKKYKDQGRNLNKILNILVPWLVITLVTTPIIAYHYFEVPFLGSLLNLIILPLFSILIILGWLTLGGYIIGIPVMGIWAKGITTILGCFHDLCLMMSKLPFGIICVGRPSLIGMICYYSCLVYIGFKVYGKPLVSKQKIGFYMGLSSYLLFSLYPNYNLRLTSLYVGQGDGSVIETPHKQIVVIDGGNFGKGKTLMNDVKSKGKKEITTLIASHSDSDHVGGLIELLESDFKIGRVIVSRTDHSELMEQIKTLCKVRHIPIFAVGSGDVFQVDQIKFEVLAPIHEQEDLNNNSLVCLVRYGAFKALFTGDKEKESETAMYHNLKGVNFLKVSHHGSKTGTGEKLLLKLRPQYAMISCGINNRYGHPHQEVLDALKKCKVPYGRTDEMGAIWLKTNGKSMTLYTQKREET